MTKVAANSPASQAGLKADDIITSIGDISLDETHSFINTLYTYNPGDQVSVGFVRDGKELQVQVTLGESNHN